MKILHHFIALLLFFPITISFIVCMTIELIFNIFNGLHPRNFKQELNFGEYSHLLIIKNYPILYFLLKILNIILNVFSHYFHRLKDIFIYDFMTKEI